MYSGLSVGSIETIALTQNSTKYSQVIVRTDKSKGFAGMWITLTAGSITMSQQCGFKDSGEFYDPINSQGTALGQICTTFGAGTYFVQYDPVLTPFTRFKAVETNVASSTLQFRPLFWEDR